MMFFTKNFEHAMKSSSRAGFSLMEVILAIGVLSLAILSLLGLFAPTMTSVKNVIDQNEATRVMSKVNAYLQIDDAVTTPAGVAIPAHEQVNFTNVTNWANSGKVLYAWNRQDIDATTGGLEPIELQIWYDVADLRSDFNSSSVNIEGSVFVIVLSQAGFGFNYPYTSNSTEGYVPLMVDIYVVDTDVVADTNLFTVAANGNGLNEDSSSGISEANLLMSYTIAKVR